MSAICIKCWNPEARVDMHLDGSGCFQCTECDEIFDKAAVNECLKAMQRGWARLIAWAESYPTDDAE